MDIVSNESRRRVPRGSAPAPRLLSDLLEPADVRINGDRPWDMQMYDPSVYDRVLRDGSLGLGECYMAGLWDSDQLDETFTRLLSHDLDQRVHGLARLRFLALWLSYVLSNRQSRARAFQVGEHHYDIGNDVYTAMLDETLSYSCGYWAEADDLATAQQSKLDLICRKLGLREGQDLLDIGCGWGGLCRHAAAQYGARVTGITVSKEQARLAEERCAGLPVTIRLMDYRDLDGQFDHIASVGMFEHVGPKNYRTFFRTVSRLLRDEGLFLLHTIGDAATVSTPDPWIDRYIFPNGKTPSAQQMARALEGSFLIEDWHNFGQDYDRTLLAWWRRFDAAWPSLRSSYGDTFYRMWKYYLHSCAGFFRSRQGQLWQIVLTKRARRGTYRSVR
jgi:cyclopropane-fatty-acyl-phospholipid synthase